MSETSTTFEGLPGRECGEHRPTIDRAWCFDCGEWCYPDAPCARCELPMVRAEVERLRAELEEMAESQLNWEGEARLAQDQIIRVLHLADAADRRAQDATPPSHDATGKGVVSVAELREALAAGFLDDSAQPYLPEVT